MSSKYYTEFILSDEQHFEGEEFSGVIELSDPIELECDNSLEIESLLAENFDVPLKDIRLISWSRLQ